MRNNLILKTSIIVLIILHSAVIGIWSILGQRVHIPSDPPQNIIASYIAVTGTEQYWDLFASESYSKYQALMVCDAIQFINTRQDVECTGNVLYKSYDGDLTKLFLENRGNQSRSYRFTEQFSALNNETLYEAFLQYWHEQNPVSTTGFLYLIVQFQSIKAPRTKPTNKLLWAIKPS